MKNHSGKENKSPNFDNNMKFVVLLILVGIIMPVFAQEESIICPKGTYYGVDDAANEVCRDIENNKIVNRIKIILVDDNSHSEITDSVNQLVDDNSHSEMMILIGQFEDIGKSNSYIGLTLGIIAIVITLGFGVMASKQNKLTNNVLHETKLLTSGIKKDVDEVTKIRNAVKEDISFTLKKRIQFVKKNLERCQEVYKKYKDEETDGNKKNGLLNSIFGNFDRCYVSFRMDIDLIKLMEIFGRETARQYWNLLTDFQMDSKNYWLENPEEELGTFMNHVNDCLKNTKSFEKIIEPFAHASINARIDLDSSDKMTTNSE